MAVKGISSSGEPRWRAARSIVARVGTGVRRAGAAIAVAVTTDQVDARVQEYWDWIAVALFLLTTVDMITTMYAARVVGVGVEANPLVRWTLAQGAHHLVAVNLVAVVLVAGLFDGVVEMLRATPEPYDRYFAAGIEAWLGGLLAAGLLVFANNLTVIFFGRSLL